MAGESRCCCKTARMISGVQLSGTLPCSPRHSMTHQIMTHWHCQKNWHLGAQRYNSVGRDISHADKAGLGHAHESVQSHSVCV